MYRYTAGYSVTDYAFYDPPPYKGKGWKITFEDIPDIGKTNTTTFINDIQYPNKAVVIHAKSQDRAQYVADMLTASHSLIRGSLPFVERTEVKLLPHDEEKTEEPFIGATCSGFPIVCKIAAKASFRTEYQYALFKHLLSHQIFSNEPMDYHPSHWYTEQFVHFSAEYQVRCSYSIVTAYAVLEELGLEIRASGKNPSSIEGEWNPIVKEDLENRLKKAGINLSETFLWIIRDTPTKIERAKPPKVQAKASWAYGKIRDSKIALIDAIAYASWLRSKVSAHKLRELASSLSHYDVVNVQSLARRLLLERLGFWRTQDLKRQVD